MQFPVISTRAEPRSAEGHELPSCWSDSTPKRALDLLYASTLLLASMPLMVVIAVLVKLSSPGPVFFRQNRVGRRGREFELLKFRTMYQGSQNKGPLVTRSGDLRVTTIGKWLRKWKLDELPQFFNVLRGDMSFVGPRPDMSKYIATLSYEDCYILRFRPGITSPATLVFRNEEEVLSKVLPEKTEEFYIATLLPQKIRTDLKYALSASFGSDCHIILQTFLSVVKV